MLRELDLSKLTPINQAILFGLSELGYDVVCVKELYHKTNEDLWMVLPTNSEYKHYVLGSVNLNTLLDQALYSYALFGRFVGHCDIASFLNSSSEGPYGEANRDKVRMFLLGMYYKKNILHYFSFQETGDEIRIVKGAQGSTFEIERDAVNLVKLADWHGKYIEIKADNVTVHDKVTTQVGIHIWPKTHTRDGELIIKEET